MSTARRSGRNARPQAGALKDSNASGSDDSEADAFAEPDSPVKKPAPRKAKGRAPRKPNTSNDAENEAPNSRAADVQDPENYVARVQRTGDQFLKDILADHLDSETEEQSAIVTLLNIVGQYAGRVQGREWTPDDYPAQTLEDLAESVQEIVDKDGGIDHFKMTLRNGAVRKPAERLKVRKKVEHFWYSLTMAAHTQGIDVLELLDPVCDFCILLCASLTWVTRYAAVTVALSVMTALVDIMAQEEDRRSMLDRQLKARTTKQTRRSTGAGTSATPAGNTPEARSLQRERDRVHSTVSVLSKRLASLFDCIVVERCRDTQAAVRTDVVEAVGTWTAQCPGQFMEDKYLRYLAWGMADREPSVRMASINAITKLLTDEEDVEALGPFVERFRHRILEAAADVDVGVCSAAFVLLQLLLQHDLVNLRQLAPIIRWFDPATHTGAEAVFRPVATQAAELIAAAVRGYAAEVEEEQSAEENAGSKSQTQIPKATPTQADTTPESGNQRGGRTQRAAKDKARAAIAGTRNGAGASKNEREREQEVEELSLLTALRSLFRLLAAEQAQQAHLPLPHSVMMLLVTHLQPQLPVLTDWQSLVPCLTAEITEGLPQVEIQDLATLTACCVEAAVSAEAQAGNHGDAAAAGRKGRPKRASKEGDVRNAQQDATLVLMDTLPELLKDWSTDQHIVGELIGMMCHLDYSLFISHKRTSAFRTLVSDVAGLFNRMHDVTALTACTQALAHCSQLPQAALSEPAKAASDSVLASTLEKLRVCGDQLTTVDESVLMEGRAAVHDNASQGGKRGGNDASVDASANLVFAMHGAIRRAMRLSMHGAWNLQLAADTSAREQLTEVIAAYLAGRPVPTTLVRGALWTLWYLLVAEVQLMYRMVHEKGTSRAVLSQEGVSNDISNVAQAARTLVQYLVELVTKVPKDGSSQLTSASQLSQHAAQTIDALDMRKHAASALIEVLCLCNASLANSGDDTGAVAPEARRQVEGLEVEVSDDVADALWAFAEGLLDEKCRLHAMIADQEENSDPESRTQKETDEINKAMVYDTTLLRMCKETVAGLMRCVLCGSLSTHSVAFAGQLLAHTPLPDGDLQTMVLAFISKLKKQSPHMVADGISHALQTIFDELCMVDSSRYGLEDFDEIAHILARPLTEFGTPQPMLASLWSAAAAFVAKDPASRTEYLSYAMLHFIPGLSSDSAAVIIKKLEAGATDEDEGPIMTALSAAEERGEQFLAALRKRASKKPMPSAMKGNKGKKPAAKRITFVDSDDEEGGAGGDEDDQEGGGSDDDAEDGDFMNGNGKAETGRGNQKGGKGGKAKNKGGKGAKGRQVANVENVKKLVDLGGGWKRRARAEEEGEEDEIEDDIDDSLQAAPGAKSPGRPPQRAAPTPTKSPATNPVRKKAAAHAAGSPSGTPSRVTRQSSQAERDDANAQTDSPLLAGTSKGGRGRGTNNVAQHTPPKPFGSPVVRSNASTGGAGAASGSGSLRGSLHASEEEEQPSSQNAPGSLAASMDEAGGSQGGVSQGAAGSLAASEFNSQPQSQGGARRSTRRGAGSQSQGTVDTGAALLTRQRSTRTARIGSAAAAEPADVEEEDLEQNDEEEDGGMHAQGRAVASGGMDSMGMDSMPQKLLDESHPQSMGMNSMPQDLVDDDGDAGADEEMHDDEEMHEKMHEQDASDGEDDVEEAAQADEPGGDEQMAVEDSEEDSEPEETMLKPLRRRR